jgi:hypothetical protein
MSSDNYCKIKQFSMSFSRLPDTGFVYSSVNGCIGSSKV